MFITTILSCVLGMPTNPYLYADDLIAVLKKKHAAGTYKSLVSCYIQLFFKYLWSHFRIFPNFLIVSSFAYYFQVLYIEACESGSIFEGLLPNGLNIYATTASNAEESSWGTYCPGEYPSPPPEYETCLGDLYAVSWMEDRYLQLLNFASHFI